MFFAAAGSSAAEESADAFIGKSAWCILQDSTAVELLIAACSADQSLLGCLIASEVAGTSLAVQLSAVAGGANIRAVWLRKSGIRHHDSMPFSALRLPKDLDRGRALQVAKEFLSAQQAFETASETELGAEERFRKLERAGVQVHKKLSEQQSVLERIENALGQLSASGPSVPVEPSSGKQPKSLKTSTSLLGGLSTSPPTSKQKHATFQSPLLAGLGAHLASLTPGGGDSSSAGSSDDSEGEEVVPGLTALLQGAASGGHGGAGGSSGMVAPDSQIQCLINLQIIKQLARINKKKKPSSGSSSEEEGDKGTIGKLGGVIRKREQLRRKPLKVVKRYIKKIRGKLGAMDPRTPWKFTDWTWKLPSSVAGQ